MVRASMMRSAPTSHSVGVSSWTRTTCSITVLRSGLEHGSQNGSASAVVGEGPQALKGAACGANQHKGFV